MTDLWSEASRDYEAEGRAYRMEMAKAASAQLWPFLAIAQSQAEFKDRVALAASSIQRVASENGVRAQDLLKVFTDRFALLMEAKGNPFDKDDDGDSDEDDQDDADESGDHGKDDDQDDHGDGDSDQDDSDDDEDDQDSDDDSSVDDAGTDDSDDNGADGDDDEDQDDDGDDNADDDESGHAKDDDQDDDMDGREAQPFGGLYSHLLAKINAGEDVATWGRRPFAGSPVTAAFGEDGAEPPVTDENTPTPEPPSAEGGSGPFGDEGMGAGMPPAKALTTKPRQTPGGDQQLSTPPGGDPGFDPAMNGGDIEAGADSDSDDGSEVTAKLRAITREVMDFNPNLTERQARKVARQVVARYLKTAEDLSPLLYGDRGNSVNDGPLTKGVKEWSPPDLPGKAQPPSPARPELESGDGNDSPDADPGSGSDAAGADAAEGAAGDAAAGGGAELALLAL